MNLPTHKTAPLSATLLALSLSACASTSASTSLPTAEDAFWAALTSHCGNAYAGGLASNDERDADWAGKRMVAHWAACSPGSIAIAFHVEDPEAEGGWNRSRTWLLTRNDITAGGQSVARFVTLKHDHRHEDGERDAVTFYGGDTEGGGTANAQDFPVDSYSIAMFEREGLNASLTNVWRMEVDAAGEEGAQFVYQLTRENDPTRLFRVEFDASREVAAPPPAWGW